MYSLQCRPQMDHTSLSSYLSWYICGLYCRLYMAYVQLVYGPFMAYVWPIYGLYSLYFHM